MAGATGVPEVGRAHVVYCLTNPTCTKIHSFQVDGFGTKKNIAPLLIRVGDLLASIDPHFSTSLVSHIQVVREFILRLDDTFMMKIGE
eukprot:scaffold2765_cov165-Amphora_coffeaeformis.AAC.15